MTTSFTRRNPLKRNQLDTSTKTPRRFFPAPGGMRLSPEQEEALRRIAVARTDPKSWGFTLSGYAGTGKTTTLSVYIRRLAESGVRIAVSAPTNKATQVLKGQVSKGAPGDMKNVQYGSIHKFLGFQMDDEEDGTQKKNWERPPSLADFDVVIVDECSMVDEEIMDKTMQSKGAAFIIFMGDPYQLAPVRDKDAPRSSENATSPSFQNRPGKGEYTLAKIVRQKGEHPIIDLSVAIRESEAKGAMFDRAKLHAFMDHISDPRVFLVDRKDIPALAEQMIRQSQEDGKEGLPVRIVAWRNVQVEEYNTLLHSQLFGDADQGCPFAPGERVLAHKEFQAPILGSASKYDPKTRQVVSRQGPIDTRRIFTSEECEVLSVARESHPDHPDVDAWLLELLRLEDGSKCWAYVPHSRRDFKILVAGLWDTYWDKRREVDVAAKHASSSGGEIGALAKACKRQPDHNKKLERDHAEIRHAYASTVHKAQGSTYDAVIVDLDDLGRMRDASGYNRALYVAVTRASHQVALAI